MSWILWVTLTLLAIVGGAILQDSRLREIASRRAFEEWRKDRVSKDCSDVHR